MKIGENNIVSIIMPAYNSENYIKEAIESVLKQTYSEWELLIVDDCSGDRTGSVIQEYSDARIQYTRLLENSGVAKARNTGIDNSNGRFIAFLDSDDIWLENKLSQQIDFMLTNDIAFSFTQYRQFKDDIARAFKLIDVPDKVDYKKMLKYNAIGCSTVIIDRQKVPEIYMPENVKHEDYVNWLKVLKTGITAYGLKKDLVRYRLSSNSISSNKYKSALWTWHIYRHVEKLSLPEALFYFANYAVNGIKKVYF